MNSDIEHLFICLLIILYKSFARYLFKSYANFIIVFFFVVVVVEVLLYILDFNSLSDF